MADGVVAERDIVAVGDQDFVSLGDGERDEVIRLALERFGSLDGNGGDHALHVERADGSLARDGVTDAVSRLRNRSGSNYIGGAPRDCWRCLGHTGSFIRTTGRRGRRRQAARKTLLDPAQRQS